MKIVNNFFSRKLWFGFLMIFSTLALSLSAAYYSVFGLSSLFAGAKQEVIIMASALELSKLVVVSYVHNHWKRMGWLLKTYLTTGVIILMIITSAGIYGFLTSAYQTTSDQLSIVNKQTEVIQMKKDRYSEQIANYTDERNKLNGTIVELANGLSNNVIQYTNSDGQLITTTSSATRKVLEQQLNDMKNQKDKISMKIEALTDSVTKYDMEILNIQTNNEVAAEIGPLRYLSNITGKSMDVVVNWFALLIIFVFDPLAVAMVISINKYISNEPTPILDNDSDEDVYIPPSSNPMLRRLPTMKLTENNTEPILDSVDNPKQPSNSNTNKKYSDSVRNNEGKKPK